jgi:hypothetical protein
MSRHGTTTKMGGWDSINVVSSKMDLLEAEYFKGRLSVGHIALINKY